MLPYTINDAPNFEDVGGPYCVRVVRAIRDLEMITLP